MSNIENNSTIENNSFSFTGSLVADIVNFVNLGNKLESLRASIAAALTAEIKASGVSVAVAAKALRAELKAAGVSKQDASKALLALGIRERAASAKKSEDAAAKAEALKPVIEALKESAKNGTSDLAEAVAALHRAHLSLQAEIKALAAAGK
jgi:SAM-dependent MidA family methyltransferase